MELKLSVPDQNRLVELEQIIDRGRKAFLEMGAAFREIRDIFKGDHEQFLKYCQDRWGYKKTFVYQQIENARIEADLKVSAIAETFDKPILTTESHYRELSKAPPETRQQIVEKAQELAEINGKPITAKTIATARKTVVAEIVPDNEPDWEDSPEDDTTPDEAWREAIPVLNGIRAKIADVISSIKSAPRNHGYEILDKYRKRMIDDLENARSAVVGCIPHKTCPYCSALDADCLTCHGRGFVNKIDWDNTPGHVRNFDPRVTSV